MGDNLYNLKQGKHFLHTKNNKSLEKKHIIESFGSFEKKTNEYVTNYDTFLKKYKTANDYVMECMNNCNVKYVVPEGSQDAITSDNLTSCKKGCELSKPWWKIENKPSPVACNNICQVSKKTHDLQIDYDSLEDKNNELMTLSDNMLVNINNKKKDNQVLKGEFNKNKMKSKEYKEKYNAVLNIINKLVGKESFDNRDTIKSLYSDLIRDYKSNSIRLYSWGFISFILLSLIVYHMNK